MVLNVPCSWAIPRIASKARSRGGGMVFRTSCAVAALLIGVAGTSGQGLMQQAFAQKALAQYQPPPPQAYPAAPPPAAAASRPYVPGAAPGVAVAPGAGDQPDGVRPPLPIGPGEVPTGAVRGDPRTHMAALPADIRPETGPVRALPPQFRRTLVDF